MNFPRICQNMNFGKSNNVIFVPNQQSEFVKKNDSYILTYKNPVHSKEALCMSEETELPLTKDSFEHLKKKCDGRCIQKSRYRIPYEKWVIELDVFHGDYEGFYMAEVEFSSTEESNMFHPPSWFGKDVSGDYHYSNSYMSQK